MPAAVATRPRRSGLLGRNGAERLAPAYREAALDSRSHLASLLNEFRAAIYRPARWRAN